MIVELLVRVAISLGLVALTVWTKYRWNRRRLNQFAAKIPGPPCWPLLGNALQFSCGTDRMLEKITALLNDYGSIMRFWLGPDLCILVSDPSDLETLLMSSKILTKGPTYQYMQDYLGQGLLSGSGSIWKEHRKIVNPAFHIQNIESMLNVFNRHTTELLDCLNSRKSGEEFNIFYDVIEVTTNSVIETLLGYTKDSKRLPHRDYIVKESERLYEIVYMRMTKWWYQIDWIFQMTHLYKEQQRFQAAQKEFSKAVLLDRLGDFDKTSQLDETELTALDKLLKEANMTEQEMLDEVFTLFTSSQESSATITSFVLLMLAMHPEYQEKVYTEIINIIGDEDRDVTLSELTAMVNLDLAFKEVLRLFPIGSLLQRQLDCDFEISSYTLPAGGSVVIPIYQLHRDPKYWDDPDSFNPERFNVENSAKRHPFAYIPFSAGPMNCVGRKFAEIIIKTICCRVLREFQIKSKINLQDLKLKTDISVRPQEGFFITIEPRKTS